MGKVGAFWAVLGVTLLLVTPLYRLSPIFFEAWSARESWTIWAWVVFVVNTLFMAHSEGYKGFQKAWSPRTAARTRYLHDNPTPLRVALAPLFVMGFFATTKKRKIVAYCLTLFIIIVVIIVHQFSQPWRGIIDAGVLVGLTWGYLSFLWFLWRAFTRGPDVDPSVL